MSPEGAKWSQVEPIPAPIRRETRLLGRSQHPVDEKGRVFLPKRFLPELPKDECGDASVVLTLGPGGCLFLLSHVDFDRERASFSARAFLPSEMLNIQRDFYRYVEEIKLKSGRLLLPERLREQAGLGDNLVMVGCGNRVELWDPERLEAMEAKADGAFVSYLGNGSSAQPPEEDE